MSGIKLYYHIISPPSRFALLTCKMLGLDIEEVEIDLLAGKQYTQEFRDINPTQAVPALVDGDIKIFDSSAISIYLVEKYAKDDSLYPKDLEMRTKVNERLFYVSSYLFPRGYSIIVGSIKGTMTEIPQDKINEVLRGYECIEYFLKDNDYLAGPKFTLCDLFLWCIMESANQILAIDENRFPNFSKWLNKVRNENEFFELNKKGADFHIDIFNKCLERNRQQAEKNE
ncbi:unnamed protein product [Chironomus riparius]|uniref:glutathione transferase n=1 Tax=Chironomus riparius TaxID=315576 RepID=A0A9N9S0T7_9DIPT|nr:unnamed protein product [Chironomus riparius]